MISTHRTENRHMSEATPVIRERTGSWKRHLCAWYGHDNIGVRNLLWGTPETLCLRCRASAWVEDSEVHDRMLAEVRAIQSRGGRSDPQA